jgi:septal ring factor EnvC (AmiA/AmiB activator)
MGKYIILKHDDSYSTLYATLGEYKVFVGQKVDKGQVIALSGRATAFKNLVFYLYIHRLRLPYFFCERLVFF